MLTVETPRATWLDHASAAGWPAGRESDRTPGRGAPHGGLVVRRGRGRRPGGRAPAPRGAAGPRRGAPHADGVGARAGALDPEGRHGLTEEHADVVQRFPPE